MYLFVLCLSYCNALYTIMRQKSSKIIGMGYTSFLPSCTYSPQTQRFLFKSSLIQDPFAILSYGDSYMLLHRALRSHIDCRPLFV